jgi:hypothetical protein
MYIKEVIGGDKIQKSLRIRYELNRDLKKGIFSLQENKNMKKMARADWISSDLIIFDDKKAKQIVKNKENLFKKIIKSFLNISKVQNPSHCLNCKDVDNYQFRRISVTSYNGLNNLNMDSVNTYGNTQEIRKANIIRHINKFVEQENDIKRVNSLVNANTRKVVASGNKSNDIKNLVSTKNGKIVASADGVKGINSDINRRNIKRIVNNRTGKVAAYEVR